MATWDDVRRLALALPGTDEHGSYGGVPSWRVGGKAFVWERPLRPRDVADLAARGEVVDGPILGVRTVSEEEKSELVASAPAVFFTTPHFDGYPAVLVRLEVIGVDELGEVVDAAWRARAPKRLLALRPDP